MLFQSSQRVKTAQNFWCCSGKWAMFVGLCYHLGRYIKIFKIAHATRMTNMGIFPFFQEQTSP
jgi:hypothetical protein